MGLKQRSDLGSMGTLVAVAAAHCSYTNRSSGNSPVCVSACTQDPEMAKNDRRILDEFRCVACSNNLICEYVKWESRVTSTCWWKGGSPLASELSGQYASHYSSPLMIRSTPIYVCTKNAAGGALVESDASASTNGGRYDLGKRETKSPVCVRQRAWTSTMVYSRSSP